VARQMASPSRSNPRTDRNSRQDIRRRVAWPSAKDPRCTALGHESEVEVAALAWLESLRYSVLHGPEIAAGESGAERSDPNYRDVVLERRLRQALASLNSDLPPEALEDAYRRLTWADAPSLVERNRAFF